MHSNLPTHDAFAVLGLIDRVPVPLFQILASKPYATELATFKTG
jgi:hypothetical protein